MISFPRLPWLRGSVEIAGTTHSLWSLVALRGKGFIFGVLPSDARFSDKIRELRKPLLDLAVEGTPLAATPPPLKYEIGDLIEAPYIDQFTGEEEVREGEVRWVQGDKLMVQFILHCSRWPGAPIQSVAHDAFDWAKAKIERFWGQF